MVLSCRVPFLVKLRATASLHYGLFMHRTSASQTSTFENTVYCRTQVCAPRPSTISAVSGSSGVHLTSANALFFFGLLDQELQIQPNEDLDFTPEFQSSVQTLVALNRVYDYSTYKRFIQQWGTHVTCA